MDERMNTIEGMARMMVGVAKSVGHRAVMNPDLTRTEGAETVRALRITLTAYDTLVRDTPRGPAEQGDRSAARHYLTILETLYLSDVAILTGVPQ